MEKEMENEMETVIIVGNKPFHFAITVSQLLLCAKSAWDGRREGGNGPLQQSLPCQSREYSP